MSAQRTNDDRAPNRKAKASPYHRPLAKSSSWVSGFIGSIIPRWLSAAPSSSTENQTTELDPPADDINNVQTEQATDKEVDLNAQTSSSSQQQLTTSPSEDNTPAARNLLQHFLALSDTQKAEWLAEYLTSKAGQTISDLEMKKVYDALKVNEKPSFHFTYTSSSTPTRDTSPISHSGNYSFISGSPSIATPSSTPRKTLSFNTNGTYRWEGGGSARASRTRNRYSSPAFGPSRSTPERIVLKETPSTGASSNTDSKRRRVGDDAASSVPKASTASSHAVAELSKDTQSVPFPVTNTPVTPKAASSKANGQVISPPGLRTPVHKPTAPAIPSPLRQTWSESSTHGETTSTQTQSTVRQTNAVNFMAGLIKEATPPKKPDLSNPYQTASPVGKVGPPRRMGKRARATGRAPIPKPDHKLEQKDKETTEKKKTAEPSPQAIIEATLPKGSKRCRPPAHLEKSSPTPPGASEDSVSNQREPQRMSYEVEEVEDHDEEEYSRTVKRVKPNGNSSRPSSASFIGKIASASPTPDIIIEEVNDDMRTMTEKEEEKAPATSNGAPLASNGVNSSGNRPLFGGFKTSTIPREPSKLRYSLLPDAALTPASPASVPISLSTATSPSTAPPDTLEQNGLEIKKEGQMRDRVENISPKKVAQTIPTNALPTFTFTSTGTSVSSSAPECIKARNLVKVMPSSSLPKYTFTSGHTSTSDNDGLPAASQMPATTFNWAAAGMKPPPAPKEATWTCSTCMLSNPASATEKCSVCETPR